MSVVGGARLSRRLRFGLFFGWVIRCSGWVAGEWATGSTTVADELSAVGARGVAEGLCYLSVVMARS